MKAFTDLEQSNKLTEFLPPESADMYYDVDSYGIRTTPEVLIASVVRKKDIPCWSLAALLELIPNYVINKVDDKIYANLYYGFKSSHDNLVDAAYEMICQLKENGKI